MERQTTKVTGSPNFDPTSPTSWGEHLKETGYFGTDYAVVNFSARGSTDIIVSIGQTDGLYGWTAPTTAHVYAQNPTTGSW
ncbi:hypothetical protein, partial [Corallococcus exiguus]|uniref:hypothetical protein n=1 Tax=Corallococcus exiguus TaxID=83462 RepID=UPI001B8D14BD